MCYSCNAADVPSNIFYYQSLLGDAYRIYTHILKYTGICSGLLTTKPDLHKSTKHLLRLNCFGNSV